MLERGGGVRGEGSVDGEAIRDRVGLVGVTDGQHELSGPKGLRK